MLIMMQYHHNVKHTPMPSEDHIYPRPFLEAREDLSLGFATVRFGTRRLGHLASGRRSSALDRLLSLELCKLRQGYYYSRVCAEILVVDLLPGLGNRYVSLLNSCYRVVLKFSFIQGLVGWGEACKAGELVR